MAQNDFLLVFFIIIKSWIFCTLKWKTFFFSFIWKSFYLYIYIEIHISSSIFLIQLCCANSAVNTSGTALRRAEIEKNKTKSKLSDYGCCFRRDSLNSPCLPVCPPAEVSRSNALNLYHGRLCTAIRTQILGCSWPIVRTKQLYFQSFWPPLQWTSLAWLAEVPHWCFRLRSVSTEAVGQVWFGCVRSGLAVQEKKMKPIPVRLWSPRSLRCVAAPWFL